MAIIIYYSERKIFRLMCRDFSLLYVNVECVYLIANVEISCDKSTEFSLSPIDVERHVPKAPCL